MAVTNKVKTSSIDEVVAQVKTAGLGFERVEHIVGSTYKDSSTAIVIPSRGMIPDAVVKAWLNLLSPMNQKPPKPVRGWRR